MSKLEVDKIDPQSGTDLELGSSGDTVTIPTGVTLDASNATTTLPANVVTTDGTQTLTNKTIDASQLSGTITPSDGTVTNAKVNASAAIDYSKLNLTGNIALADLSATGTKDATTFLRGDNTFATVSSGTYSVHAIDTYRETTGYSQTTASDYVDIANGQYVQFTPTSTNDLIQFSYTCPIDPYTTSGANTYLMMSTSTSIGSGDTKLDYDGRGMGIFANAPANVRATKSKTFIMPCTSLTVGTTYYVEQAGSSAANGNWGGWNNKHTNNSGDFNGHYVSMVHYKYNG